MECVRCGTRGHAGVWKLALVVSGDAVNIALRQLAMPPALIAFLAGVGVTGVATARPGDLDPTFGNGGRVFVDVASDSDVAATVVLQADGKIVVGRSNEGTDDDFSVLRFNRDGSTDTTFDGDGRTTLDVLAYKGTTRVVLL